MANVVIGAVGAVIGGYFGGLNGAAWGWSIGSAVGSALFPPDGGPSIDGPRAADLSVMTSQYGVPIPDVQGTGRVGGNVIWSTEIVDSPSTEEVGGKGGSSGQSATTHHYSVSMAVLLTEGEGYGGGPIIGVSEIWFDGQLYYIAEDSADAAALFASNQRIPHVTVYTGTETQLPDPTMEAHLGVGNVPAYRGEAYIVFTDLPLVEPYFGRRPNITCKVVKGGGVVGMREITTNASISGTRQAVNDHRDGLTYVSRNDGTQVLVDLSGNTVGVTPAATFTAGTCATLPILNYSSLSDVPTRIAYGFGPFCNHGYAARDNRGVVFTIPGGYTVVVPDTTAGAILIDGAIYVIYNRDSDLSGTTQLWILKYAYPAGGFIVGWSEPGGETVAIHHLAWDAVNQYIHVWSSGSDTHRILDADLNLVSTQSWVLSHSSSWNVAVNGNDVLITGLGSPQTAEWYTLDGSYAHTFVDTITPTWPGNTISPRFVSDNLVATGAGIIRLSDGITITEPTEGELVLHYALQAGLQTTDLDVSALTGPVHGIIRSRVTPARNMIQYLMMHGWFDFRESGGKIVGVKRGGPSLATITADDLGAHAFGSQFQAPVKRTRSQEIELPKGYTVTFIEPAADYGQGSARSPRTSTTSKVEIVQDLPVAMSAQKGAQIASVLRNDAWNSRERVEFTASSKWQKLEPCDPITLTTPVATHQLRVTRKSESAGLLSFEAQTEQAAIYTPNATASASSTAQTLAPAGPTSLDILESPLLRDQDDGVAAYAIMDGYLAGWKGATLFRSTDAGSTWGNAGSVTRNAASGFAITALGNWAGGNIVDELNSVDVTLRQGDTLSSTTYAAMIADRAVNAAALVCADGTVEVLQFRTAALQSGTTYRLTGFLRGRGGTEDAVASHSVGDVFVTLSGAGMLTAGSASDLSLSRLYEAVTTGSTLGSGTRKSHAHLCRPLKPLSCINFASGSDGASGLLFQWVARHRKSTIWQDGHDVAEDDPPTSFALEIWDSTFIALKRTISSSVPNASYTFSMMSADGTAYSASIGTRLYKISPSVGRGVVAQNVVTLPGIAPTLLLHFDGTDGSTTFTDSAGHTMTPQGNVQLDTANKKFGTASGLWDGANDRLDTPDSADWYFATGNWTIEFFCSTLTSGIIVGQANDLGAGTASWAISTNGTTYIGLNASTGTGSWNRIAINTATYASVNFGDGTWRHVAISCQYPTVWIFIDGVQYAYGTLAGEMPNSAHALTIGNGSSNANDLSGWLDEMRIVKGTAIYRGASAGNNGTTYFTPPSGPF